MAPPSARRTGSIADAAAEKAPSAAAEPGKRPPGEDVLANGAEANGAEANGGNANGANAARARRPKPEKKERRPRNAYAGQARRRRGSPLLITAIAVLAAATASGGVYTALTLEEANPTESAGPVAAAPPGDLQGDPVNVAQSGQVAPLERVVPPDVLAVGGASISTAKIKRIAKLRQVGDVLAVAGGAVQLQGRQVNAFAVDPSDFRAWTPPGTAKKTELWEALAGGQFVVSPAASEQLQLAKGTRYPVVGRTMPSLTMGGSGTLGLPGIDMLVSQQAGTDMGLIPNVAVLVNAPGADPAKVVKAVTKVLGPGTDVVNLHESKYQNQVGGGAGGGATSYMDLYKQAAGTCPGLSWTVLAAIGQVESSHGRDVGPSSAGALGPMQFMPATWKAYGVDGDRDGKADIMNPYDAIPGAANYLCANGAGKGGKQLYNAIWHYNHAHWYVQKVLGLAKAYAARYD
ncbi:lytic transglycosylase domain-containing protein [Actinomadura sp. GC306]|uniref:lytic transglycosylase domain-containing protein n=1 Tax=Actinomadura sp. GC306 TaxID=2530367 RepID=UPI001FB5A425|nr:lytic transglycosylase domain-containing protein [Actinomadura sp. GC306]